MRRIGNSLLAVLAAAALAAWLASPQRGAASDGTAAEPAAAVAGGPAERRGALVDQVVFTEHSDAGKAVGQIETGTRHLLAQGVSNTTIYQQLRKSRRADFELSYGSSAELTLNPAGPLLDDGRLNPFASPAIREALNWLVDREHLADEVYGGLAEPRYLPLSTAFPDYARLADVARELELRYRHQPERARRVIADEMRRLGAQPAEDGRWTHDGEPVRLTFLIRTEDARKQVGDYLANLLEQQGFEVERLYRTAEQASALWIATDPAAGRWHLYTGGWVSTAINRDEAQNFSAFYTRAGRPYPLWQAYRPTPELDEVSQRLERRDYATWAERQALMARALRLAMQDSARIWLVDALNVWPHAADVQLASDLAGGVAGSRLWPYTLRFRGRTGGEVVVSTPTLLTEPWNPVAGTNWLYDRMIINALGDVALLPDPYTGLFWPQRITGAEVTVAEGTPVQRSLDWLTLDTLPEIRVPANAWAGWDEKAGRFATVGERHPGGLTARSRVRITYEDGYLERRWHDGSQVSPADLVLPLILQFARADEASPLFDRSHVPQFQTFARHFRGLRLAAHGPLVVEIYSDQIYPDAETIVAARAPAPLPWHTLALGIRAERSGELAFSSDKADRARIPWLSLVSGPSLPVLDRHREAALAERWVPYADALAPFLGAGEVEARYRSLRDWREQRGHYWVDDGPFYLDALYPVAGTLVLRRHAGFPDRSDKWLRADAARIPDVTVDGPMIVGLEAGARFQVAVAAEGRPYPRDAVERVGYLLLDGAGSLVRRGEAEFEAPGRWRVDLSGEQVAALGAGANRLEVTLESKRVALPRFASHVFATVPGLEASGDD